MKHFINAFKLYGVFSGRSTREEYWMFTLVYILTYLALAGLTLLLESEMFQVVLTILSFGVIIPSLSITARRLHDVGRSGWWQVAPYIGMLFSFVGMLQESQALMMTGGVFMLILIITLLIFLVKFSEDDNKYGSKPKLIDPS